VLVPMYDIDLMWHTHLSMDPSAYAEQCRSAIGWVSPASVRQLSLRLRQSCTPYAQHEHGLCHRGMHNSLVRRLLQHE
jgi:hypothetical protein